MAGASVSATSEFHEMAQAIGSPLSGLLAQLGAYCGANVLDVHLVASLALPDAATGLMNQSAPRLDPVVGGPGWLSIAQALIHLAPAAAQGALNLATVKAQLMALMRACCAKEAAVGGMPAAPHRSAGPAAFQAPPVQPPFDIEGELLVRDEGAPHHAAADHVRPSALRWRRATMPSPGPPASSSSRGRTATPRIASRCSSSRGRRRASTRS